ncbi:acyl-CoA dehydrogenase [Marinihelvus fidelis]|uniref:Acyl-coenzyme A dehydrogenase n=1 Tax=Marinihelvus fidelis TaxID=2613842 RepID=A0A5N0TAN8_9GAMM|nr:acyl-CoA dehydrogenase [Marinihelvus fidelis]KAA9132032.1 acyl-CoA dehydrogenase [Marinihelvus fidelis]
MTLLFLAIIVLTLMVFAYNRIPLGICVAVLVAITVVLTELREVYYTPSWFRWMYGILAVTLLGFSIRPLRRLLISNRLLPIFRKVLPKMSDTEREALDAGTVWWDAELFSGRPRWRRLLKTPAPSLSAREQAFLDGPVEELCRMLDDWEICDHYRRLPEPIWSFLREHRFFSMIIPESFGGLGFSAQGNSAVVMKLASRNLTTAVTVMVPNSLGPGELLLHYGTDAQKNHYLPRLASGEDIPCFALTGPTAGSDAAGMPDTGVVCMGEHDGQQVLGFRLNWNKRYITLAPVATVLGLAFRALDPDGLLGEDPEPGITCALIPVDTPGIEIGNRHMPVGSVFQNGPTRGKDVFIPMDWVIGGQPRVGQGWRMLMQSLAAGRAISLPALGTSGGKMSALLTGAYARVRKQFDLPIGLFEGVQEPLARIAGRTYRMDAARRLTLVALDEGEKPSVLSAIVKYQLTEGNRQTLNDAMDIHGGKGIITGPNNYLAHAYQAVPISITVEGANILTRSLIIFGQGAIRAHPWLLKEMRAAGAPPSSKARRDFDHALFSHVGYVISNKVRAFVLGVTGGWSTRAPVRGKTARYYRQLTRLSAAFAFLGDSVLLVLGGKFKFRETLSGRFADALIHLYLASAVLKRFEDDGRPAEDLPLVQWSLDDSLYKIQQSLLGVMQNYPLPGMGRLLKWAVFPLGLPYQPPSDAVAQASARLILAETASRDRITEGVFISDADDAAGRVLNAFHLVLESADAEQAIRNALKESVTIDNYTSLVRRAVESGVITEEQATAVRLAQQAAAKVIAVDDFPKSAIEGFDKSPFRPASDRYAQADTSRTEAPAG